MSELKTLKDMIISREYLKPENLALVDFEELKAEAVKWVRFWLSDKDLKKQMKSKFIVFSDDTLIGHLFPEEIKHKDYVSINDLIKGKISKHTFAAINPEYFNIPSKYK